MILPQVYISGYEVDISEVDPIVVDLSIADIKDPSVRKVGSSKSITLPGTPNNDFIFKQLFILGKDNNYSTFNPNLKATAFIQVGSGVVLEGYFQLNEIVVTDNGHKYIGVIYEDGKLLFSEMGDSFLTGNTTSANDVDLETGTTQVLYQYTSTEYGKTVANNFVASSREGGMFMTDFGTNTTSASYPYYLVPYQNLRMGVKFKHIWDRIFAKYNTTYSSSFINSTAFKSMVYMDTHKTANLTTTQYNNILASVKRGSDSGNIANNGTVVFDTELQDTGNRYNNTTGVYSVNSGRNFTFVASLTLKGRITFTAPQVVAVNTNVQVGITLNIKKGVTTLASQTVSQTIVVSAGTYATNDFVEYDMSSVASYLLNLTATADLLIGDSITTELAIAASGLAGITPTAKVLNNSTFLIKPTNNSLSAGDVYNKNSVPASQHKQKDFILDCIRMFNLFLFWDGTNYVVEPRDTFYTSGNTYDWTDKVDRTQGFNIKPLGAVNWKQLTFVAKKDSDYYSDTYFTNNKEVYGQQNVINGNEFVTGTQKIELSFAPPLSVSLQANYPKLQHIYKLNNGVREAIDGAPRYGYWAGWVEEGIVTNALTGLGVQPYDGYLYVGEFNNPVTPTLSVLFGPPREIYYQTNGVLAITDYDLYTNYYSNQAINDTNLNAKVVTARIKLNSTDINNLKMYDKVIIDGVLFIISKISSFNTFTQEPVEVELIQYEQ